MWSAMWIYGPQQILGRALTALRLGRPPLLLRVMVMSRVILERHKAGVESSLAQLVSRFGGPKWVLPRKDAEQKQTRQYARHGGKRHNPEVQGRKGKGCWDSRECKDWLGIRQIVERRTSRALEEYICSYLMIDMRRRRWGWSGTTEAAVWRSASSNPRRQGWETTTHLIHI